MDNFKSWIFNSKFIDSLTVRGDIARDIMDDPDFPISKNWNIISDYVELKLSQQALIEFKKIYDLYSAGINNTRNPSNF